MRVSIFVENGLFCVGAGWSFDYVGDGRFRIIFGTEALDSSRHDLEPSYPILNWIRWVIIIICFLTGIQILLGLLILKMWEMSLLCQFSRLGL